MIVRSKRAAEGLVEQRLLQRLQRGELPLAEAGEALGFFRQGVNRGDNSPLLFERRKWDHHLLQLVRVNLECAVGRVAQDRVA